MSLRDRILTVVVIIGVLSCAQIGVARDQVQPTGTPTWVPKKAIATPTPLTPVEAEAKELGMKLAKIDLVVWTTVRTLWDDSDACFEAVDAHLAASKGMVESLILESNVINCSLEEGTKRRRIRLNSEEARRTFVLGYHDAIASLRALRNDFETNPEAQKVLDEVRHRQRVWQRGICEALESVKPPEILPEPRPIPRDLAEADS